MADEPSRLEVLALEGIPEIGPGDDLASLVVAALKATAGALPARDDDVLVVTQKVVSKAEGAVVDLTTIEPRPEVVAFAEREAYYGDPNVVDVPADLLLSKAHAAERRAAGQPARLPRSGRRAGRPPDSGAKDDGGRRRAPS